MRYLIISIFITLTLYVTLIQMLLNDHKIYYHLIRNNKCKLSSFNHNQLYNLHKYNNFKDVSLDTVNNNTLYCNLIEENVMKNIKDHLIKNTHNNINMLMCVSGGSDSIAMLHIMKSIKEKYYPQLNLMVVNFNHKLRIESDEECEFVKNLADSYRIPFYSRILPEDMRVEVSLQAIARDWRRKESLDIINTYQRQQLNKYNTATTNDITTDNTNITIDNTTTTDDAINITATATTDDVNSTANNISNAILSHKSYIATAHHFDDQIETILLKFIRGVHISNIQSMEILDNAFYKPLVNVTKKQLTDYLIAKKYEWREDKSNLDNKYKRNAIRLDLIPLLAELSGGKQALEKRLLTLSEQSKDVKDWINVEVLKYQNEIEYESNLTQSLNNNIAHIMFLKPITIHNIPKLVLIQIINNWIINRTNIQLSSDRLYNIYNLIIESLELEGLKRKSITISKEYDIERYGYCELRLKLRQNNNIIDNKIDYYYYNDDYAVNTQFTVESKYMIDIKHQKEFEFQIIPSNNSTTTTNNNNNQQSEDNNKYLIEFSINKIKLNNTLNLQLRNIENNDIFLPHWKNNDIKLYDFIRGQKINIIDRDKILVLTSKLENIIIACIIPSIHKVFISKLYSKHNILLNVSNNYVNNSIYNDKIYDISLLMIDNSNI